MCSVTKSLQNWKVKATFEVNAEQAGILKTVGKRRRYARLSVMLWPRLMKRRKSPKGGAAPATALPLRLPQPAKAKAAAPQAAAPAAAPVPAGSEIKATPVASAIIADKRSILPPLPPRALAAKS